MKVILAIIAVVMICGGVVLGYSEYHAILGKEIAEGRVAALEPREGSDGGTLYVIVAEFYDRQGNLHTYRSGFSATSTGYNAGDKIRIYFNPNKPSDCGVLSFGFRFGLAWSLICLGLAVLIIQIGIMAGNRWLEGHFPATISIQQTTSSNSPATPMGSKKQ